VTQICVRPNQVIAVDEIVARLQQPELQLRIRNAEMEISDLKLQNERITRTEEETLKIDLAAMKQERANALTSLANYDKQIAALRRKFQKQREALEKGLIVESTWLTTESELFGVEQAKAQAQIKLTQLTATEVDRPMQIEQQRHARRQRLDDAERSLELLKKQMEISSVVRSPYAGRVLELTVDEGNLITAGGRVLSVEKVEDDLQAVLYIPAADGKKVQSKMTVRVSPSTVRKEEAGYILASVASVLPFPSTPEGMMRVLRNNELVRQLSFGGAPIEVHVVLEKTEQGGYRWSSTRKTPAINSGTLCEGAIIVERQRPISLVLPMLKSLLGS